MIVRPITFWKSPENENRENPNFFDENEIRQNPESQKTENGKKVPNIPQNNKISPFAPVAQLDRAFAS